MLKLCEDEKKQNNELCEYEIKLKNAETKKLINQLKQEHQEELVQVKIEKDNAIQQMRNCFEKEKNLLEDRIDSERSRIDRTFTHGYTSMLDFKPRLHQSNLSCYQSTNNILDELSEIDQVSNKRILFLYLLVEPVKTYPPKKKKPRTNPNIKPQEKQIKSIILL